GDGRRYQFGIALRGATATIEVALPDDADLDGWPAFSFELRGLAADDLFALLGLTPPEQLAGEIDFDLDVSRTDDGRLHVQGGIGLREIGFYHRMISTRPIRGIDAGLQVDVFYDHDKER